MLRRHLLRSAFLGGAAVTLGACAPQTATEPMDLVDVATANDSFTTLVTAVETAVLVENLKSEGPFTVFAPTDAAFAALPDGTVESLLLPENRDQLTRMLTYHVVPGRFMAADLAGRTLSAEGVNGATLAVDGTKGVRIDDATVTAADVMASNGVIHMVDRLLLPN